MAKKKKEKTPVDIGHENQSKYEKIMQKEGFLTDGRPIASRFTTNKDYYNQFDIVGMKFNEMCWVQVKTNCSIGKIIEEVKGWIFKNKNYLPLNSSFRVAILKKKTKTLPERWEVAELDRHGTLLKKEVF